MAKRRGRRQIPARCTRAWDVAPVSRVAKFLPAHNARIIVNIFSGTPKRRNALSRGPGVMPSNALA
eukprot:851940-Pyramimonas_sp.AAC.1